MARETKRLVRVAMVSLGCAKNTVDAEIMLGELAEDGGFALAPNPRDADVIVVNTCGFLESARAEGRAVLGELLARHPRARVAAVGCWAERDAAALRREFPALAAVWGFEARGRLAERLTELRADGFRLTADGTTTDRIRQPSIIIHTSEVPSAVSRQPSVYEGPRLLSTPSSYAYLRLSDGCDNRCAYCAIPLIRGPYRERPTAAIVREARTLTESGARELVLVAQDTTRYGGRGGLARLLARKRGAVSGTAMS